ncbi:helix-turn-helix domain-containing protein [Anoxybacillus eryuanensis]|uniref:helix-turn-helix domain-containing protein n=1 Tax=Anoxybacillus eryuanensis TaxID=651866 RepID=UPI003EF3C724
MLQHIVLFCIDRFRGERSLAAIDHLLNGKKTAQTLQDSKWYDVSRLFGMVPIDRSRLFDVARALEADGFISQVDEHIYCTTASGKEKLRHFILPPYIDGWKYMNESSLFWKRLSLLIQTISNIIHRTSFEPIHRDEHIQSFVKRWLFQHTHIKTLARSLYEEMYELLSYVEEKDANIFVWRLTSHERIGWTNEQIAYAINEEDVAVLLSFQNVLHFMLEMTEKETEKFPLLYSLRERKRSQLTSSAQKTWELLKEGYSLEQIAQLRGLRKGTIEDHIVEIATYIPTFVSTPFLEENKRKRIIQQARQLKTKKLRAIKELLPDVSYFEIRLALARWEREDA